MLRRNLSRTIYNNHGSYALGRRRVLVCGITETGAARLKIAKNDAEFGSTSFTGSQGVDIAAPGRIPKVGSWRVARVEQIEPGTVADHPQATIAVVVHRGRRRRPRHAEVSA